MPIERDNTASSDTPVTSAPEGTRAMHAVTAAALSLVSRAKPLLARSRYLFSIATHPRALVGRNAPVILIWSPELLGLC